MKVILTQEVKNLGKKGSVVEVAEGYGRNFLIPRGAAIEASQGNMRNLQNERAVEDARVDREANEARKLGQRLNGLAITVRARSGEAGKLFGSVTNKDVAQAIATVAGIKVDRRRIESIDIKTTGTFRVSVKLHPEVTVAVDLTVVAGD